MNKAGQQESINIFDHFVSDEDSDPIQMNPSSPCEYLTEGWSARQFIKQHAAHVRYNVDKRAWFIWDGRGWVEDDGHQVYEKAKYTVAEMFTQANQLKRESQQRALRRHAMRADTARGIDGLLRMAQSASEVTVNSAVFDQKPWLFNVQNGTINLSTGEICRPQPQDMLTQMAPVTYDPKATCPTWESFLKEIMAGDMAMVEYLQRVLGYALTGDTSERCLFVLYGPTGANGKSTLLETWRALLGDYARQTETKTLMQSEGERVRNDLARLQGARFVTAVESKQGHRWDAEVVKQLTGNDTITARYLFKEHFEYRPQYKIFLATNHKPTATGTDNAFMERVRIIPFNVRFEPHQRDKQLGGKLRAELSGILNWAIKGCLQWQAQGLGEPPAVQEACAEYHRESDPVQRFLDECCNREGTVMSAELYEVYKRWAKAEGEFALSQKKFTQQLKAGGYTSRGTSKGTQWTGLSVDYLRMPIEQLPNNPPPR